MPPSMLLTDEGDSQSETPPLPRMTITLLPKRANAVGGLIFFIIWDAIILFATFASEFYWLLLTPHAIIGVIGIISFVGSFMNSAIITVTPKQIATCARPLSCGCKNNKIALDRNYEQVCFKSNVNRSDQVGTVVTFSVILVNRDDSKRTVMQGLNRQEAQYMAWQIQTFLSSVHDGVVEDGGIEQDEETAELSTDCSERDSSTVEL